MNQTTFCQGINFASAGIASALVNLTSAVTFVMALVFRLEQVQVQSLRGAAKIVGTIVSVAGAAAVSLLKGPTLFESHAEAPTGSSTASRWLLGSLLVFSSCWCWSTWLILQVPVTARCPNHLYSTFLTCLFGTVQSTVVALCMERRVVDWKVYTGMEYAACVFSGVASAVAFFGQAWCISRRGPFFSVTFNPLSTITVAIIGSIFLDEPMYISWQFVRWLGDIYRTLYGSMG